MIRDIEELNFPKSNGKQYATLSQATVRHADMGEKVIETQVKIDGDIVPDFTEDWAVAFRGEKYIMPLRKPAGSKENTSLNATIDLTFQHWAIYQLKRWPFVTIQSINAGTVIADEEVADVQLNLDGFCDLFGQVLNYYYGDTITIDLNKDWKSEQDPTIITISHSLVWDVLVNVFHDKYGVRWAIEPREDNDNTAKGGERYVIKVGYPATEVDHIFEYGYVGGLLKIERQVQSEEIRNMIKGRGGEQNLPRFYFKKSDDESLWRSDPDWVEELKTVYFTNLHGATFRSYVQGWKAAHISKYPGYTAVGENNAYAPWAYRKGFTDTKFHPVEFVTDEVTTDTSGKSFEILPGWSPYIVKGSSIDKYGPLQATLDNNDDIYPTLQDTGLDIAIDVEQILSDDVAESVESDAIVSNVNGVKATITALGPAKRTSIVLTGSSFTVDRDRTANFIAGTSILKVTESGSSTKLDIASNAEIESTEILIHNETTGAVVSASGIPEGTYYYTITVTVHNLTTDKTLNISVGTESPKIESATIPDKWRNTFEIWVKNIWGSSRQRLETNYEYAERVWKPILGDQEQNSAKVVFSTGSLAHEDYEFTIVGYPVYDTRKSLNGESSHWRITLAKSDAELEATSLYIPSTKKQGKAGDKFVFTGVEMTHNPYVTEAEKRLDNWKKDQLREKKDIKPTYVVTTDKVRLNNEGRPGALIDQLRIGNSIRLADKRFIAPADGLAYETLYLQSVIYTYREPTSDDAALNPDVEIVLGDDYVTSGNAVSMMQGEISALQRQVGSISNIEQIVRAIGDRLYLRKDGISEQSLSPTQFLSLLTSGGFRSGLVGGAGWGIFKDENGNWVIETDRLNVRQDMSVNTLVINQVVGRGGMEVDTAAFMEVTRVVETADGYVCYFDQKDGSVANLFRVNDVAYCNRWTPEYADLKFYKRRVMSVAADSITLTKGYEGVAMEDGSIDTGVNGDGTPAKGDNIIQYGNYTDKERQYAKVRDVVGGGYERYIEGLDSVNAAGIEYYFAGRQTGMYNNRPRWYIGDDNGFIEWINGVLNIKGHLSIQSIIGGKTVDKYVNDAAKSAADTAKAEMQANIDSLQKQVDGVVEAYNGQGAPTLSNYPANGWATDEERKRHDKDIYTDITPYVDNATTPTSGQSWKWYYNSPTDYGWVKIADSEAVRALQLAQMSVTGTDVLYISHTSQTTAPALPTVSSNGAITDLKGWSTTAPAWDATKYIWQTTYIRKGDGFASFSDPTCISGYNGKDGAQGIAGQDGKNGVTTYTWIRYADDAQGGGISNNPTGKAYIGFAYNKVTATESNNPADYQWSEIKGEQGVPGAKGADGKTYYTWIKYSDNADGSGMYDTPKASTKYIGIAVNKETQTEGTNPADYTWSLFKGADGTSVSMTANEVRYSTAHTASQPADSTFTLTAVPTLSAGQYLWSRTTVTYSNGQSTKSYAVSRVGTDGANGKDGANYSPNLLVDTEAPRTITASSDSSVAANNFRYTIYYFDEPIEVSIGDKFTISVENIEAIAGSPTEYSVYLYNATVPGTYGEIKTITQDRPYITLQVTKATTAKSIIIYAGKAGHTSGNSVRYTKVMMVKGETPTVWSPAASEMLAPTITSTSVTYAKTTGTVQPADSAFTYASIGAAGVKPGEYLWTKTVVTYSDGNSTKSYSVGRVGADGANGTPGAPGVDGKTPYTHWAYANSADGVTGFSTSYFDNALYMGICTDYNQADPTTPSSYEWARMRGQDGDSAKVVIVNADNTAFTYKDDFKTLVAPTDITLTATLQNTSGYQWSFKRAGETSWTAWLDSNVTAKSVLMAHNGAVIGSAKSVTVRCTSGGVYDEVTIVKVSSGTNGADGANGEDGYTVLLTNESHIFKGDTTKAIAASAECGIIAYKGATLTAATIGSISGMPTGMTVTIANNGTTSAKFTVNVTTTLTTKQGTLNVPVTVDGKSFTRKFSWSLSLDGRGITATAEYYAINNDSANAPADNEFTTTVPQTSETKRYLWNYEKTTYSDNTYKSTSKRVIGVHGQNGADGAGISKIENFYLASASASGITTSTAGWTTDASSANATVSESKPYLWNYEKVTYTTGNPTTTAPHVVGKYGADGNGIDRIEEEYYLSTSRTALQGGSWSTTRPAWVAGRFYWTRSHIYYTDGTDETVGEVCVTGETGAAAPNLVVQYSADGMSWHATYQSGDIYMRTSNDGGKNWSVATRFVGSDYSPNLLIGSKGGYALTGADYTSATTYTTTINSDGYLEYTLTAAEANTGRQYRYAWVQGRLSEYFKEGETYTISVEVKSDCSGSLRIDSRKGNLNKKNIIANFPDTGGEWLRVSGTLTMTNLSDNTQSLLELHLGTSSAAASVGSSATIRKICLTKGTSAEYVPAASEMTGKDGQWRKFQWAVNNSTTTAPTSGWQDTPMTVAAGQYVWMRSGIVVPPATNPATWEAATRVTGDKGADGQSTYMLDLSNEVSGIICDANGSVTGAYPSSVASVYRGGTKVSSGVTFSIASKSGISTASISTAGVVTMSGMTADSATVTVQAIVSGVTLQSTINLYKVKPGSNGKDYAANLLSESNKLQNASTYYLGGYSWANRPAAGTECTLTICGKVGAKDSYLNIYQNWGSNSIAVFDKKTESIISAKFTIIDNTSQPHIGIYRSPKDDDYDSDTYVKWAVVTLGDTPQTSWTPSTSEMEGAVLYSLQPSVSSVSRDAAGNLSVKSISATKYITKADKTTTTTEQYLYYRVDSETGSTAWALGASAGSTSTGTIWINTDTTAVVFELRDSYGTVLDRERVPVLTDAAGMAIGGTNLLRNSDFIDGLMYWDNDYPAVYNIVTVPGFEDKIGWFNGRLSAKVAYTDAVTWRRLYQEIPGGRLEVGKTYIMSGFVYIPDMSVITDDFRLILWLHLTDGKSTSVAIINLKTLPEGEWGYVSGRYTVPDIVDVTKPVQMGFLLNGKGAYYVNGWKLEEGNVATAWSASPDDVSYLRSALRESTTIEGGLVAATMLELGITESNGEYKVTAGMNGSTKESGEQAIAFWAGGKAVDAVASGGEAPAKVVIRHNGTAYFCGNTIRLDASRMEIGEEGSGKQVVLDKEGLKLIDSNEQRLRVVHQSVGGFSAAASTQNVAMSNNFGITLRQTRGTNLGTGPAWTGTTRLVEGFKKEFSIGSGSLPVGATINVTATVQFDLPCIIENADGEMEGFPLIGVNARLRIYIPGGNDIVDRIYSVSYDGELWREHKAIISANVTLNKAGVYRGELSLVGDGTVTGPIYEMKNASASATVDGSVQLGFANQTVLGNDGFLTIWGESTALVNASGAHFKAGNYELLVTPSGIYKKVNGVQTSL